MLLKFQQKYTSPQSSLNFQNFGIWDAARTTAYTGGDPDELAAQSAAEAEGRNVETIEGMADGEELHPLQRKFIEHAALQCGVCTPGFLIAAKDLLERNSDPTEEEIRFGLAGNLCRCTGYDKIVRAVQDAAREMRG